MSDALVLSGGGARGDFEVGALQYLYDNGFYASTICTTSVGSVNGVQLAVGGNAAAQKAAFSKLMNVWQTQLTVNADMYDEAPWLVAAGAARADIVALFSNAIDVPSLLGEFTFFPPLLFGQVARAAIDIGTAIHGLATAQSVFTLNPTRAKITAVVSPAVVAASGVNLRLVSVGLESGQVRMVTENGSVLNADGSPVPGDDPSVCAAERGDVDDAKQALDDARTALHEAANEDGRAAAHAQISRAQAGLATALSALGSCLRTKPIQGLKVGLIDGVIASAAIPCIFPPVTLGNESCVDGGVRWILPMEAALAASERRIVAINASPAGVPPTSTVFRSANMLDIAERTVADILLWETQERQLEVARLKSTEQAKQVWVITPRVSVHDLLTIDPGLIDIHIDYGYMCAADVLPAFVTPVVPVVIDRGPGNAPAGGLQPVRPFPVPGPIPAPAPQPSWVDAATDPNSALLADAITMCRYQCWDVEHDVFGAARGEAPFSTRSGLISVPSPGSLDDLRVLKTIVGLLMLARQNLNGAFPASEPMWADGWERHSWTPADVPGAGLTPWDAFVSAAGNRPAAVRPSVLLVRLDSHPEVYLLTGVRSWVRSTTGLLSVDPRGFAAVQVLPDVLSQILSGFPPGPDIA